MSINTIVLYRSSKIKFYGLSRLLGDVNAIKKGTAGKQTGKAWANCFNDASHGVFVLPFKHRTINVF
ncbi:hypothetical protein MKZ04_00095 [Bacillus sp. FSL W7-1354]|uniref:hypothetical protein n=1 Tax=Bacillus sp. FSL W7-1354 TaxID=2921597 RepID=UPI0030FA82DD